MNKHKLLYSLMVLFCLCGTQSALSQIPFWQPTNGPDAGDIKSLIMDSEGNLFASTYRCGIFLSTNAGISWTPINNGFGPLGTAGAGSSGMLACNPVTHSVFVAFGCEVWRTIDKGQSWVRTSFDSYGFGCGYGIIAIRGDGSIFVYIIGSRVIRSQDDGQTWQAVGVDQVHSPISSFAFLGDGHVLAGTQAGVYISSDNGDNWSIMPGSEGFNVSTLGVDPYDNDIHVATYGSGPVWGSTYRYVNGGWIETEGLHYPDENGKFWYIYVARCFGFYEGAIYVGTPRGAYCSLDHGLTYTYIGFDPYGPGYEARGVNALAVSPQGDVFAGTSGDGVFKWAGGTLWTRLAQGMKAADVLSLVVARDGGVLAGTMSAGIFRSADKGETWTRVNEQVVCPGWYIYSMAINSYGYVFAAWGAIDISLDGGITWPTPGATGVAGLCVAVSRTNVVYAGGHNGILKSTDNGATFYPSGLGAKDIRALAINSLGHIFAGGLWTGLWRSVDDGNTWTSIPGFENVYFIGSIVISPKDDVFFSGHEDGVMRSSDGGNTWDLVYRNQSAPVLAINAQGRIFAGNSGGGVLSSIDNGNSWQDFSDGLMNLSIVSFAFDADGYLYCGHYGGGVSRTIATTFLNVPYTFDGFFSPIENAPVVNQAKAGQSVHIKWRITDKNGLPVSDPASFVGLTSYQVNCAAFEGDPINSVEEPAASASGLQYLGDGWWQFNWKTSKAYKGQCRVMKLILDDKSEHTASFRFK
jgi:photosystem II stability/assembly factor-like uncharacterized protein